MASSLHGSAYTKLRSPRRRITNSNSIDLSARECRHRALFREMRHDLRRSEVHDRPHSSHAHQDCGERDKEHRLREGAEISRQAHDAELLTKRSRGLPSGFYEAVRA